jgi:hypothetical protein
LVNKVIGFFSCPFGWGNIVSTIADKRCSTRISASCVIGLRIVWRFSVLLSRPLIRSKTCAGIKPVCLAHVVWQRTSRICLNLTKCALRLIESFSNVPWLVCWLTGWLFLNVFSDQTRPYSTFGYAQAIN